MMVAGLMIYFEGHDMRSLLYLLLVFLFFFEQGSSAPIPSSSPGPTAPKAGDFVGVRPAAYEEKSKDNVGYPTPGLIIMIH
jgi:hypothetical protein